MHTEIKVYSKPECPLCDKALEIIQEVGCNFDFKLEIIDITKDDELFAEYCFDIPVVAVNGVMRFKGVVDKQSLKQLLRKQI